MRTPLDGRLNPDMPPLELKSGREGETRMEPPKLRSELKLRPELKSRPELKLPPDRKVPELMLPPPRGAEYERPPPLQPPPRSPPIERPP